jgi:hypothetical protein
MTRGKHRLGRRRRRRTNWLGEPVFTRCDHCGDVVSLDANDYWIGQDGSSDCPRDDGGHVVDGQVDGRDS